MSKWVFTIKGKTCSLWSWEDRVWRWHHIHARFHWSYHLEEVSKWSTARTHSAGPWHFEETLTALGSTRNKGNKGSEIQNALYTQPHRESNAAFPLKSLFTAMRAPTSELGGNRPAKQSPTVKEGRKFRGAPPLKCFFRVSYVTFQEGKKIWSSSGCDIFVTRSCGE